MYLNASTDSIEIILGGTVTANQLQWNVSYQDITSSGMTLPQSAGAGLTNNATLVTMVAAPAASTTRQVTNINVYNADTATATVTIRKDVSGTKYVLMRIALTTLDVLMWSRENGWRLMSATGGGTTYTFSTGLTNTGGTVTANLSTGVAGGQSVVGGTAASNSLTLSSTTNATKGKLLFGTSAYDEVNNRLGIGTQSPAYPVHSTGAGFFGTGSPTSFFLRGFTISGTSGDVAAGIFNSDTSTGTAGFILGQSNTVFTTFVKYGSTYAGNHAGSSIPIASSSQFQSGPSNNLPMLFQGTPLIFNCGLTGTNTAVRLSSGSLHITTLSNAHVDGLFPLDVNGTSRFQNDITISDTRNIVLATGTGTKIATATTQKLGFWNAAPIAQPTTAVASATRVGGGGTTLTDTDTFDGYTLAQVVKALRNAGLLA